jgi:GT2 family glycosyltransferase
MDRCAVVLVNYFGAVDIAQAVHSVLCDDANTEVLVMDNSADPEEFARLRSGLPAQVRVVDAGGNVGFGRACNVAWHLTSAPFVFFVNPDVRLLPGCIHALLDAMLGNERWAAVAPRQFLDGACQWHMPPAWLPTALRAWVHEFALRKHVAAQRVAQAQHVENLRLWSGTLPVTQRALSGGALMLRRSVFDDGTPPFDPRFFMYYEDSDLCLRLRRRGLSMAVVPQARAVHAWRNLPHKGPLMEDGARVYFDKHWPVGRRHWLDKAASLGSFRDIVGGWVYTPVTGDTVPVPMAWREGWVLELSPSPLLYPAAGMLGTGPHAWVSDEMRACFCNSPFYGRLSRLGPASIQESLWLRWS